MAEDKKTFGKHNVTMESREKVSITGVVDVISFDEEMITAETEYGILILKGEGLHVTKLDLDYGELAVEGIVDSLFYEEQAGIVKSKGSLFSKIFK